MGEKDNPRIINARHVDGVRNDTRYLDLLKRLGLDQATRPTSYGAYNTPIKLGQGATYQVLPGLGLDLHSKLVECELPWKLPLHSLGISLPG